MKWLSLALVGVFVLTGASTVSAQRKSTEPSTIVLNAPVTPMSASVSAWPALGDVVSFTATYPKQLESKGVRIQVMCYQDGNLVYGMAGPHNYQFQLGGGSSQWYVSGGAASCVATLYYWSYNGGQKFNYLAETHFEAADRR